VFGSGREFGGQIKFVVSQNVEADARRLCIFQEDGQRRLALAQLVTSSRPKCLINSF
jgi:hypothetical protein